MTCLMTVRCKVCMTSYQLSEPTVVVAAELATFTWAHDHEVIDFDLSFDLVDDEASVSES
jgi:hypothetical protein